MQYRALILAQLIIATALSILQILGVEHYLYWRFVWLDTLAHTLAGISIGLFIFSLRLFLRQAPNIAWGIAGAIVIGVAWEVFEVVTGMPREANWAFDTSIDLLMDVFGGALGGFLARFLANHSKHSKAMV